MDAFVILFLFVLPLFSVILSVYTLIQVLPFKKMASKLSSISRSSGGKDSDND